MSAMQALVASLKLLSQHRQLYTSTEDTVVVQSAVLPKVPPSPVHCPARAAAKSTHQRPQAVINMCTSDIPQAPSEAGLIEMKNVTWYFRDQAIHVGSQLFIAQTFESGKPCAEQAAWQSSVEVSIEAAEWTEAGY